MKKNRGDSLPSKLVKIGDDRLNSLDVIEILKNPPVFTIGMHLLVNEELEKEFGGYESESKEDAVVSLPMVT